MPVCKSASVNKTENDCPVSILPVVLKIMAKEFHKQFQVCLKENKLILDFQFGFGKNKPTELAAGLVANIRPRAGSVCIADACFLYLSKVTNKISHAKLALKLTG